MHAQKDRPNYSSVHRNNIYCFGLPCTPTFRWRQENEKMNILNHLFVSLQRQRPEIDFEEEREHRCLVDAPYDEQTGIIPIIPC